MTTPEIAELVENFRRANLARRKNTQDRYQHWFEWYLVGDKTASAHIERIERRKQRQQALVSAVRAWLTANPEEAARPHSAYQILEILDHYTTSTHWHWAVPTGFNYAWGQQAAAFGFRTLPGRRYCRDNDVSQPPPSIPPTIHEVLASAVREFRLRRPEEATQFHTAKELLVLLPLSSPPWSPKRLGTVLNGQFRLLGAERQLDYPANKYRWGSRSF